MINDAQFREIEKLKWLPFIGDNLYKMDPKTLIIGESHYYDPLDPNENFENDLFTRWITDELGLCNRDYTDSSRFFKSINYMFANGDPRIFWHKIAFYNFIQRAMLKNKETEENERPSKMDYQIAWEVFFDVVKVIKPENCLFFGVSMVEGFNLAANKMGLKDTYIQYGDKINGAYFKYSKITINNKNVNLYFIKHPSKYFSADKWIEKLKSVNPSLIESLT